MSNLSPEMKKKIPDQWKTRVQTKIDLSDTVKRNNLMYIFGALVTWQ